MSASPPAFPVEDRRAALLVMQWLEAVQRSDAGAARLDALGAATAAIGQAFNVDPDRDGLDLNPEFHSLRKLLLAQSRTTPGSSDTESDTTPAVGVDALGTAATSGGGGGGGKSSKPKRLRAVQSAPAKFPAIGMGGDLTGRHILLVDDVKSVLKLGTRRLVKAGAVVTTAGDGHEAVAEVAKAIELGQPFDMVLMDLHMPKMDGIEATKQIRANHGAQAPLVIGLTADELVQATTSEMPRTPPRLSRKVQRKRFAPGVALSESAPPRRATSKARLFTQSGARGVISKPYTIAQILDLAR